MSYQLSLKARLIMSNELTQEDLYAMTDEELMSATITLADSTDSEEKSDEPMQTEEQEQQGDTSPEQVSENTDNPNEETNPDENLDSEDENQEVDYQAFYQSMTKPFKANGREISVKNADDAIKLMQMGADYSKKMEQLKPKKALLKVLEENKLDNKEQLGYLIDLANKKPEAIAKLIKESNIDLYDFDVEQADGYTPNLEINEPTKFEEVLSDVLSSNPQMSEVVNDMGQWDNESKEVLFNRPDILKVISEQKANGFYDKVVNVIESERLFGRMTDVPFLQAYSEVEAKLLAQEKSFTAPRPNQPQSADNNADKKRKASTPNNGGTGKTTLTQSDLYKLSDDELNKLIASGEL